MLSGLSLANLPTTTNLNADTATQVQPATADTNTATKADASQTTNNQATGTKADQTTSTQAPKDFKQVIEKTVSDSSSNSNCDKTTSTQTTTEASTTEDEEETEVAEAVAAVMATISATLSNCANEIELNLDLDGLSVEELDAYGQAVDLIDQEVQTLMTQTIEEISDVDMTELSTLTEKSEQLDDLQSLHEELIELKDAIKYSEPSQETTEIAQANTAKTEEDKGIKLEGFTVIEEVEYKAVNTDLKLKKSETEEAPEEHTEITLPQEINLQALQADKPKEQFEADTESLEIQAVETQSTETAKDVSADIQIQTVTNTEIKQKDTVVKESFLDKVKFLSLQDTSSVKKEDVSTKANVDATTKQVLIQAADEIKAAITERSQNRLEFHKADIEIDIRIEDLGVNEDTNKSMALGVLTTDHSNQPLTTAKQTEAPVTPKQLLNIVQEKVIAAPANTEQTIRFQLTPKELGTVTITISNTSQGVTIHMIADNDAAISSLKNDLSNLHNSLREKGLELKELDVSKASSEGAYNQQQQRGDFNEAREEQKRRMTETQPHWLQEENSAKPSFESQLKGMLKTWQKL